MATPLMQIFLRGADEVRLSFLGAERRSRQSRKKTMARILFGIDAEAQRNIARKFSRRTGNLSRMQQEITESGDAIIGKTGPVVAYGLIHEVGGTITPKRGRYLAIPSKNVQTAGGVARKSPREFTDTFFHRRGDRLFLMQKKGASSVELLFTLVTKVTLKARPYLTPALRKREKHIVDEIGTGYITGIQKGT